MTLEHRRVERPYSQGYDEWDEGEIVNEHQRIKVLTSHGAVFIYCNDGLHDAGALVLVEDVDTLIELLKEAKNEAGQSEAQGQSAT